MRVGKKTNSTEIKQTRSCVVLLEKVPEKTTKVCDSPIYPTRAAVALLKGVRSKDLNRATMGVTRKVLHEDKKNKAPLKKRLVNNSQSPKEHTSPAKHNLIMSSYRRPSQKVKILRGSTKPSDVDSDIPIPTIAIGRSRRAIKPNPKYTSEDLVTPKNIRNMGSVTSDSIKSHESNIDAGVQRRTSSSLEGFFNHETSDEIDGLELQDSDIIHASDGKIKGKQEVDSDFLSTETELGSRITRGRGRPRKLALPVAIQSTSRSNLLSTRLKTSQSSDTNLRSTPLQIHQARRSLGSTNTQRSLNAFIGQKRKLEETDLESITHNDSDLKSNALPAECKHMLITSGGLNVGVPAKGSKENIMSQIETKILRKNISSTTQTLNGSKVHNIHLSAQTSSSSDDVDKVSSLDENRSRENRALTKSTNVVSRTSNINIKTPDITSTSTQAKIIAARATAAASKIKNKLYKDSDQFLSNNENNTASKKSPSTSKMSNSQLRRSNTMFNKCSTMVSNNLSDEKCVEMMMGSDEVTNSTIDNYDSMPTFTIVNVNDIINKKGDVMITKSKNINHKSQTIIQDDMISNNEKNSNMENEKNINRKLESSPIRTTMLTRKIIGGQPPQILNHKLGMGSSRSSTIRTSVPKSQDKPAPRILNAMVAKKTHPIKPLIANLDDSADESVLLSLDEETEDEEEEKSAQLINNLQNVFLDSVDERDSQTPEEDEEEITTRNTKFHLNKRRQDVGKTPIVVGNKKRLLADSITHAIKDKSQISVSKKQINDTKSTETTYILPNIERKLTPEKVIISRQGNKIIKKITSFETWHVIDVKEFAPKRSMSQRNDLDIPLIILANDCKLIPLPSERWRCKVTLYEVSAVTLAKSTLITYTGDITDQNISEENRSKYQPSSVMFRRLVINRQQSRLPYDRAVIFKNGTFFMNIEGKNITLLAAPIIISSKEDIAILLNIMDTVEPHSDFVETSTSRQ